VKNPDLFIHHSSSGWMLLVLRFAPASAQPNPPMTTLTYNNPTQPDHDHDLKESGLLNYLLMIQSGSPMGFAANGSGMKTHTRTSPLPKQGSARILPGTGTINQNRKSARWKRKNRFAAHSVAIKLMGTIRSW
jgi:hypothetical protein